MDLIDLKRDAIAANNGFKRTAVLVIRPRTASNPWKKSAQAKLRANVLALRVI